MSVCILRSKKAYDARVGDQDGAINADVALGQLGAFMGILKEWGDARPKLSRTWTTIEKALSETKQAVIVLEGASWNILDYVDGMKFRNWWRTTVDSIFASPTWPFECPVSTVASHHISDDVLMTTLRNMAGVEMANRNLSDLTVDLAFGILIGGLGSPPHVDTSPCPLTMFNTAKGEVDSLVSLALAVGYLIQGRKYFWALPPRGGHTKSFLELYRDKSPNDISEYEDIFREDILKGGVPHPFQGQFSMGWPSEQEWDDMKKVEGVNNHFHPAIAGDRYIVVDGTFHAVCNDPDLQPVAVAHDDHWVGGYSDLAHLRPKLASLCLF